MNRRVAIACLLLVSLALNLRGQEPDQDVVRITTNLVQVDVVVTKDGKQVIDLKPEDFEILEDGRAQQITSFAYVSTNNFRKEEAATPISPAKTVPTVIPKPLLPREVKRTIAIVVDDLGMSFQSMANLRDYLSKFLSENLKSNDLIAIIRTGGEVGALQQFTSDPRVLANAIADLKWNPCSRVGANVLSPERSLVTMTPPERQLQGRLPADRSPGSAQVERQSTANESNPCSVGSSVSYSINALRFILRGLAELPGRKSMMIISDNLPLERQELAPADFGFKRPVRENANVIDVWTQSTSYRDGLHSLGELAIRGSVVIYGITSQRLQTTGPQAADEISYPPQHTRRARPDQPDALTNLMRTRSAELRRNTDGAEVLAKETGGFVVRNKNDFGLERVFEDQSGYYLIGYRPAGTTFDRRFHTIQARVKRGGFSVRTRGGFFGVSEDDSRAARPVDRMNRALASPFGSNDINVRVATYFANDPARGSLLRVFLNLDPKNLTFTIEPDGTHVAKLDLSSVLFGDNGSVANRQDQTATLRLRGKPYERALREGVVYGFDWPLKQTGAFQLRVALRDVASQKVGASGQLVHVPKLDQGEFALSDLLLQADVPADEANETSIVSRRFHQGTSLVFGYAIYNASLNKSTRQLKLTTRTLVFRDAVNIYSSDAAPVNTEGQTDLQRISTGARLQLGPALTPGEYVLQIIVEDQSNKRTATQWTQFEVVK
ncbi:MAG TPA: VWA domain-containing protein [Pyrinomonadaceae bacterium]|nr:VWA domain-containing protein [Pyrinomonadaceae bacterium]